MVSPSSDAAYTRPLLINRCAIGPCSVSCARREPFLRFEGDSQHDRSHGLYFPVMPPQLRQVFPSRESSKMAQENKDYLMPFELSQRHITVLVSFPVRREIREAETRSRTAQERPSGIQRANSVFV